MKQEAKDHLKKQARSAAQNGKLIIAKDARIDRIDRDLTEQQRAILNVIKTDRLCLYVGKNPKLEAALDSIADELRRSGKTGAEIQQEFKESRRRKAI